MPEEEDRYTEVFCPHLWRQRRSFILGILHRFKISTVLDYGCGEAAVLSYLIPPNEHPITKITGIDLCEEVLVEAVDRCTPWQMDYDQLRDHPLVIDLYQGSIGVPDDRFKGFQGIVCTEVIEHVFPDVLDSFLNITLGIYQPEIMIVTTPNAEYNVNFPDLKYGTNQSIFRHDDHKFEWTRKEFESWCDSGAEKYGYDVEYHGIGLLHGKYDELENGHCTQACVFIRRSSEAHKDNILYGNPHKLVKHIEYPYHNEVPLSEESISKEIVHYIEALCKSESYAEDNLKSNQTLKPYTDDSKEIQSFDIDQINDWDNFVLNDHIPAENEQPSILPPLHTRPTHTKAPFDLPISNLWDILRIRQICSHLEVLLDIVSKLNKEDYELINNETLVVRKVFELDWDDDDNLSAKTFSSHNSY